MVENDPWQAQLRALGSFIRTQRQLADLSLREMGDLAKISNAYLSQVERGLHQPSVRVLRSIAAALGVPADELLAFLTGEPKHTAKLATVRADGRPHVAPVWFVVDGTTAGDDSTRPPTVVAVHSGAQVLGLPEQFVVPAAASKAYRLPSWEPT